MAEFVISTLMDGYAGGPHITETQIGLANQATFGPDDYVLAGGRESEAQVLTNNSIRIFDGVYCIQGRRDVVAAGGYTDVTIANGSQGMNRNDVIVRRYKKDESSEIETTEYAVIKGTANSGTAVDPKVTTGDIRSGATLHEMALYRVKLQGLNIVAVEPMFKKLKNMDDLLDEVASKIGKTANLIELLTSNAKVVQDCLTQTGESGIYKWYNATNQPCTGGYILVFKYNDQMSFRIAIGNSGIYASMYRNGTSYGSWVKICTYSS